MKEMIKKYLEENNSVVQQTEDWIKINKSIRGDEETHYIAYESDGKISGVLPLCIIKNKLGNIMNSLPYHGSYGGIVCDNKNLYETLIEDAIKLAKEKDCVLFTIVSDPFSDKHKEYIKIIKPDYIYENFMTYNELNNLSFNKKIRWDIKTPEKHMVSVNFNQTKENVLKFYEYYKELMVDYGSRCVPEKYFLDVFEKLVPENKAKFIFGEKKNKIIAGIMLINNKNIIDYIFSAYDKKYRSSQINSLLIYEGMKWAKSQEIDIWNWQSCKSKSNSTFNFKKKWGAIEGKHYYYTKVLGDIKPLLNIGFDKLREIYKWYYVLPKFVWDGKTEGKHE